MKYFYSRYWGCFATTNPETSPSGKEIGFIGFGYSGHEANLNDIHKQNLEGIGPLPSGRYIIDLVYDDVKRGSYTCRLKPDLLNNMYGRSGFLIHGDTMAQAHAASDGCIIAPRWVRMLFAVSDEIEVI